MDKIKFHHDITVNQFHLRTRQYYKLWCRVSLNDPAYPATFWNQLLLLLPGSPSTSHLAQIQAHLGVKIMENHVSLLQPIDTLKALEKLAKTIGMPEGSASPNPQKGGPQLNMMGDGDGQVKMSDCSTCDSFECTAACRASNGGCISRPSSKLDIQTIKARGRRLHVAAGRAHWRANPKLSNIKGVKLQIFPKKKKDEKADGGKGAKEESADGKKTMAMLSLQDVFGTMPTDAD